jgi:hypothetical protein
MMLCMITPIPARELTYYELLDVSPRASGQQLAALLTAELYLVDEVRLPDAPALVRQVARDRRLRLQAAEAVLTNPTARRKYDLSIGLPPAPATARVHRLPTATAATPVTRAPQGPPNDLEGELRQARYASSCPSCSQPIDQGDLIGPITAAGGDRHFVCARCYHTEQAYLQR